MATNKLNKDIKLFEKKKVYPAKRSMNLMMKRSASSWMPNVVVYTLFGLVVLLALGKVGIYDPIQNYRNECARRDALTANLDALNAQLTDYDEISEKYKRYSYGYLTDDEKALVDRIGLLDLVDQYIGTNGELESVAVSDNTVSVTCDVASLDVVSAIVAKLYESPLVTSVQVSNANTDNGTGESFITSSLVIAVTDSSAAAAGTEGEATTNGQ